MTPYLADQDLTLYVGDALEVLQGLPDGSVDCCVTSPPYWGLRDYSVEGQIGLEATPDLFVAAMVAVFREVRRVLAPHGTCWVNLGDSYGGDKSGGNDLERIGASVTSTDPTTPPGSKYASEGLQGRHNIKSGLKPKDLVGVPWRVAFALQADGWWLRSDIVWAKPNPMPESVTDRPTKAHEYLFLLTKQPRYWFDAEAVREPATDAEHTARYHTRDSGTDYNNKTALGRPAGVSEHRGLRGGLNPAGVGGRNVRSVWEIATQPYPEAHFATFPEELPRRAIAAGCPLWVCRVCGKPRERIVERESEATQPGNGKAGQDGWSRQDMGHGRAGMFVTSTRDLGWSDCGCLLSEGDNASSRTQVSRPGDSGLGAPSESKWRPGVVLDPFAGAGTTLLVARKLGRASIGIELNPEYAELIARRTRQLSLLAETTA